MKRGLLLVLAVLVLLPLAVVLGAGTVLNTGAARLRILEAVQRATGHAARIDGPIGVAWSLTPAVAAQDVALLNAPGFSRPDFVSLRRVEAQLALMPLLAGRVEIRSLIVEGPDALLERDAAGRGNWLSAATALPDQTTPAASRARTPVVVRRVQVENGRLAWQGLPPLLIEALSAAPSGGPVTGTLRFNDVAFDLKGQTQATTAVGVPFDITAVGGGLALAASGAVSGSGGVASAVGFQAMAPDLAVLATLAGRPLPALRDVVLSGQIGPGGASGLKLVAGASDLATVTPGLRLAKLQASMAAPDQPTQVVAQAALRELPVAITATIGRLGAGPVPAAAQLSGDGATAGWRGMVADFGRGLEGALTARVPDLQRTGALAGMALPDLKDVALDVRVSPVMGGAGVLLRGLQLATAQGDVAGDLAVGWVPKPSLRGALTSQRLDLDAWTARLPQQPGSQPEPSAVASSLAPPTAPAAAAGPHWLISDQPLPFAALLRVDVDLRFAAAEATYKGATYRQADVRLLLQDGRLRLDPAVVQSPGGPVQAVLQADAGTALPTAAVTLRAAGLDAAGLSSAIGMPGAMTGTAELDIDVHFAGASPHAMAASIGGHAAMALSDGDVENAVLARLIGSALRGANIPFDAAGRSRVRCLALRSEVVDGKAAVQTLALDTSRLRLEGNGQLDLANETMDLHVRPVIRLGPTAVEVPVRLMGAFQSPRAQADKGVIAPGRFGISIGGAATDICGPALAAVAQDLAK